MRDSELLETWRKSIAAGSKGVQLIDPDHPLEIYVGTSEVGEPRLQLLSAGKPSDPNLSEVVQSSLVPHHDRWLLSLTLRDGRFLEAFLLLAGDVVARSAHAATEEEALRTVDAVFAQWHRLLRGVTAQGLSLEELRGLVGELWVLRHLLVPEVGAVEAVESWLGPLGSPQDFYVAQLGYLEVKTVGPTTTEIRISSAEQLDQEPLTLCVVACTESESPQLGSVTLNGLLDDLARELHNAGGSTGGIRLRLARLGLDLAGQPTPTRHYVVSRLRKYRVDENFPAVRASVLPLGVERLTYSLNQSALTPYLVETHTYVGGQE